MLNFQPIPAQESLQVLWSGNSLSFWQKKVFVFFLRNFIATLGFCATEKKLVIFFSQMTELFFFFFFLPIAMKISQKIKLNMKYFYPNL